MKLVIGDKNLSSWSMRAWLVMRESGLAFDEVTLLLDRPETATQLREFSPSGKVPCLIQGNTRIWDSLAICEFLAEHSPGLWPTDPELRASARSYVAEMHSGFNSLRTQLSMDLQLMRSDVKIQHLTPQTISDIERILFLWRTALSLSGGEFLFGKFGIVDAFYAPVVFRFKSYGITIEEDMLLRYMRSVESRPSVQEWLAGAMKEERLAFKF